MKILLIKDLPDSIKMLAKMNQMEAKNPINEEIDLSSMAAAGGFDWSKSPQGRQFWVEIFQGNCKDDNEWYPYPPKLSKDES